MSLSSSPSLAEHLTRLSDALSRTVARRRPWQELVDRSAFSRPASVSDALTRLRKNATYFRVNYLAILAFVLAASLLSHPFSLIMLLSLLAGWLFLYLLRPADQPIVVFNRTFSNPETFWILIGVTLSVVFLTNIGSLLMSTTLIGMGVLCAHGAFRDPEDLFLDDQDMAGAGLLSFVNGGSVASGGGAKPAVASRV